MFDTSQSSGGQKGPRSTPRTWEIKLNARLYVVFTELLYTFTKSELNYLRAPFAHPAIGSFHQHAYMADRTVERRAAEWNFARKEVHANTLKAKALTAAASWLLLFQTQPAKASAATRHVSLTICALVKHCCKHAAIWLSQSYKKREISWGPCRI